MNSAACIPGFKQAASTICGLFFSLFKIVLAKNANSYR
jgi:hypothetical protein